MLMISGAIVVREGDAGAFVEALRALAREALAEGGAIGFEIGLDVDGDGRRVLVMERWPGEEVLASFLERPNARDFFSRWGGRIDNGLRKHSALDERGATE